MPVSSLSPASKGFFFGLMGVAMFAVSVPATKLATITQDFAGLPPVFIAIGRASVAGFLSILYLAAVRAPWPSTTQAGRLILAGAGIVIGFPLFSGLAVQYVEAIHAAVITGALPLATAAMSALLMRERASRAFWLFALIGFALVLAFAWISTEPGGKGGIGIGDWLMLLSVLSASIGYVLGARLSREMEASHVICWILVLYLPFSTAVAWWSFPQAQVAPVAWGGFAYVSIFSMWLGFFAWYRGLAMDPLRVSQAQLVQPFLSMIVAVPLLGESMTATAIFFCVAIILCVAMSRKLR